MTQLITRDGFVDDTLAPTLEMLPFAAFWEGQDLPHAPLGVEFAADSDPTDLLPWLEKIALVRIPFSSSADGRGFSLAARLRDLGYRGRIRAAGHVLVDQFRAALRVGIDEIEISDAQAARMPESQWLAVIDAPSYQQRLFAAE